ncbi:MAG: 4-hydroxy-tetrahydrodipicolinate reductase [Bacillota bacterium]
MDNIRVAVSGALGRMGREVCRTVLATEGMELVDAFDSRATGEDIGAVLGTGITGIIVRELTLRSLREFVPQVLVDFTTPLSVMQNIAISLEAEVRPVVGTTGITGVDLERIRELVKKSGIGAFIAPNFALGAVLLMKFAAIAARFFPQVEIIELHHDQKIDAPSGTALKTAEMIVAARLQQPEQREELLKLPGVRGGVQDGVHIHSVRLSGLVAHQEVLFGGQGQTLSLRHDSYDRNSFMPGVVLAIKKAHTLKELVYGLENILDL